MTPPKLIAVLADTSGRAAVMAGLAEAFARMDAAYGAVARHYGFLCRGCDDNCCRTRFYHHTLAEVCYLFEGYTALTPDTAADVHGRAEAVVSAMARADAAAAPFSDMCPVNALGRCLLYDHRPMICRLHGLPNAMTRPDGVSTTGAGCAAFHQRHGGGDAPRLDRTPHYSRMAQLEQQLRRAVGWEGRLKLSVADMICIFQGVVSGKGRSRP